MKKIIMFFLMLTSLFIMVGCKSEKQPQLSAPNDAYFTATEDGYTYSLSNKQVYDQLKRQVGFNVLLDMVDSDLMKSTKKGNQSYWDLITEEKITTEIEKEIFPNGKEDLTPEELQEAEDKFFDNMFLSYGFNEESEVRDYYHMNLAKEAYVYDALLAENPKLEDKDFQNYYKSNYYPEYYAIIVSYETMNLVDAALAQWGVKIKGDKWVKIVDETELSELEIVEVFINLYNTANSYKTPNYPSTTLLLNQDDAYSIEDGEIVFDLDEIDTLHYTRKELVEYEPLLEGLLNDTLAAYGSGSNFYTKAIQGYRGGSLNTLVLKIAKVDAPTLESVKDDIREELLKQKLTSTYISKKMIELRAKNNFTIYDDDLEAKYVTYVKGYELTHKTTKKLNGNLVAKTDAKEYSADDLFVKMNESYGISLVVYRLEYLRFIMNPKYNKIYSMNKNLKESERILDKEQYDLIKQDIKDERSALERGDYEQYGYGPKYGWENFIKATYGVNNEEELFQYHLYTKVKQAYSKQLGTITSADSELAQFYTAKMTETMEKYFKVKGMQFLITVPEDDGNEDKNEFLHDLAKEFYEDVLEYLADVSNGFVGTDAELTTLYEDSLKEIVRAYKKAPRFKAGMPQDSQSQENPGLYVFENIEISKYKTAGLKVEFLAASTFTNGKEDEEFDAVLKEIWELDTDSKTPLVWSMNPEDGNYSYIQTDDIYRIYINLESTPLTEWETDKVIPTIENIIKYNNDDSSVSSKIKTAISTYYTPIYNELTGSNNTALHSFTEIKALTVSFGHQYFTETELDNYLQLNIDKYRESLVFAE
jgi:hypothetical protein